MQRVTRVGVAEGCLLGLSWAAGIHGWTCCSQLVGGREGPCYLKNSTRTMATAESKGTRWRCFSLAFDRPAARQSGNTSVPRVSAPVQLAA
jgi:hypothetical protein